MGLLKNSRALNIISSAQITLNNVYDAYTVTLSNDNFNIVCNNNGDALAGEIGSSGRAITTTTVCAGATKLTAVSSNPTTGQYSISISSQVGCTAAKSGNDKVYINTLTNSVSGKVTISFNIEGTTTVNKDMTFIKSISETEDSIDGKFAFGTAYWASNQTGTGNLGSNVKVVTSSEAIYGANLLEMTKETWVYSRRTIDIEKDKIYRCRFRAKQSIDNTTGGKTAYFGYTPYDSTGATIGTNGAGNMYFKSEALKTTAWTEWEYYVSTTARAEVSVTTDGVKKIITPAVIAFPSAAVKFRPVFIVNFNGGNGIALADGWMLEDVTDQFAISDLEYKSSQIETTVNGIDLNVKTIKTYTDMSTNPMTLVAKVNYSAYATANDGEIYLHGLDSNRNPADVNGTCIWNSKTVSLPKVMINPNGSVPDGQVIYLVRNISDSKWWSVWEEVDDAGTSSWKKLFANQATDAVIYNHTWSEANDIVVGYYIVKVTNPKSTEAPILMAQLFDGALNYKQATTMTLNSSITQIELLEDELELKVQKNDVIASINLYTQEDANGTTSGIKIRGDKLDLEGQVTFSSLADSDVAGSIKSIFTEENNKTVINGGMIQTQSIKGNDLLLKGNLTVTKTVDDKIINTFAIKEDGGIEIDGILKSSNFSEADNTGYKISTDGTAIFNQAQIKGDVILARAGMTNFGGPIGNSNLAINSYERKVTTWRNISNDTSNYQKVYLPVNAAVGDVIYVSYIVEYANIVKTSTSSRIYIQGSGNTTQWTNGTFNGGTVFTTDSRFEWGVGKSGRFKIEYKFTLNADMIKNEHWSVGLRADYIESGTLYIKEFKVERGESWTPWCPHESEQNNYVRIWAGSEYDKRNTAPFRVYQNGDIYATNGIFSGRVLGHIDSGNIHIDNGEFVINSSLNFLHNNEIITIDSKSTKDANPNPYIKFSLTENFINTDLVFGTRNDKRLFYNNNNRELVSNISFIQNNSWGSIISNKDVVDGSTVKGFTIIDSSNNNGGKHRIKYWKGYTGMIFESYGARQNDTNNEQPYDFKFERLDGLVNVKVQGNIELTNSIQGTNQNIQLRSVNNEGWGFFVI